MATGRAIEGKGVGVVELFLLEGYSGLGASKEGQASEEKH